MFISSNTHPPAKRCHALMKLFGLPAPVAKELCSSLVLIFFFFFCLQIYVIKWWWEMSTPQGAWTTERRIRSKMANSFRLKNEPLCVKALFLASAPFVALMRLVLVHVYILKVGCPEIRRLCELHGSALLWQGVGINLFPLQHLSFSDYELSQSTFDAVSFIPVWCLILSPLVFLSSQT